jgi:hypothetical protein
MLWWDKQEWANHAGKVGLVYLVGVYFLILGLILRRAIAPYPPAQRQALYTQVLRPAYAPSWLYSGSRRNPLS